MPLWRRTKTDVHAKRLMNFIINTIIINHGPSRRSCTPLVDDVAPSSGAFDAEAGLFRHDRSPASNRLPSPAGSSVRREFARAINQAVSRRDPAGEAGTVNRETSPSLVSRCLAIIGIERNNARIHPSRFYSACSAASLRNGNVVHPANPRVASHPCGARCAHASRGGTTSSPLKRDRVHYLFRLTHLDVPRGSAG